MSPRRGRRSTPPAAPASSHQEPRATSGQPVRFAILIVGAAMVAWFAAGELTRRAQASRLPPLPDLSAALPAIRSQVVEADRAARAQPSSAAPIGDLAVVAHASLLNVQALQLYAVAASLDPADRRWPYYQGLLLEERGDHEPALAAFLHTTTIAPGDGQAWLHVADIRLKRGDADGAADAYRRVREAPAAAPATIGGVTRRLNAPLAAYGELGLARLLLDRGSRDEARAELDRIVKAYPSFGSARALRRQLRDLANTRPEGNGGSYVPPVDPLLDAIVARSQHPELLLKHAALAGRGGDTPWREFLARRALAADPKGLDVLMEMSATLQAAGRLTEALDFLRQAEAVAPGDHHILVEQGKSLSDLGRLAEAEQVLRRACRVRDAAAEYNLATVLDRAERWDEARTHYEQALAINPFHTRAMNNLGVGLDRRGQTQAALSLYQRALTIAPDDSEVLSNLGSALINVRRFDEALEVLRTAVALEPDAPNPHNNLGIALAQSGQVEAALVEFRETLRLDPRHDNARRNLDAISRLKQR